MSSSTRLTGVLLLTLAVGCGGGAEPDPEPRQQTETLTSNTSDGTSSDRAADDSDTSRGTTDEPKLVVTMTAALRDLTSDDAKERAAAVAFVNKAEVDPDVKEQVVLGLVKRLADSDDSIREAAVDGLAKWADGGDVVFVAGVLARDDKEIRHRAIAALGRIGGPDAAVAIAERLESAFDRAVATRELKGMGADAEAAVLPFAESTDKETRLCVVEVLHEVGVPSNSLDTLVELQSDPEAEVAVNAQRALMAVETR